MGWAEIPFGDDLKADLFYPADKPAGKWPVVIWLHPYSVSERMVHRVAVGVHRGRTTGSSSGRRFPAFVKRGFAVLAFDQIGFGARVRDARDFYRRYPKWSLMGKMVADTRAAIDALAALDVVDASRISLMGYSLGAKVGLLTTALDPRVHALAVGVRVRSAAARHRRIAASRGSGTTRTCTG